jgi:hypothetical protein
MAGTGKHRAGGAPRGRGPFVATIVALVVIVSAGGYYLLTRGSGTDGAAASATPSGSRSPSASSSPSPSPSVSASASPSSSPSASPSTDPNALPPGRNFAYAKQADGPGRTLTLDLAYYYTGQEAADQAKAHGDESPPPNGYYIVNDNPKLRTVPVSSGVVVRYIPENRCCALKAGTWDGFAAAVDGSPAAGYPNMDYTPWWVTVVDGEIVRIQQQFLP